MVAVTTPPEAVVNRRPGLMRSLFRVSATIVVIVVAWMNLAPQQIGGRNAYVMVSGISMLPHFHAGDLVIVRRQANYQVGEVVAYQNEELHETVMHRIVALDGARYVFKGDNNGFTDTYEPTKARLIGKEVLHFAGGARYFLELRKPFPILVLASLAVLIAFSKPRRSRAGNRHRARARR